jgi:hypothetical protein
VSGSHWEVVDVLVTDVLEVTDVIVVSLVDVVAVVVVVVAVTVMVWVIDVQVTDNVLAVVVDVVDVAYSLGQSPESMKILTALSNVDANREQLSTSAPFVRKPKLF